MTFSRALLLFLPIAVLLFAPVPSGADTTPLILFEGGGAAAPKSPHKTIRLDSQEVVIRLKPSYYSVDAVFHLHNTGETATEWTGFPEWWATSMDARFVPVFSEFRAWVNGRETKFTEEIDRPGVEERMEARCSGLAEHAEEIRWFVYQVTFAGHADTMIRIAFDARYGGRPCREARYMYGTGSLWKGRIGSAVFIVDGSEMTGDPTSYGMEHVVPRPIGKRVLKYELRDFEPKPEATLRITPAYCKGDIWQLIKQHSGPETK